MATFRFRFRVRYQDCDAQRIIFNARWADYIDIAATEFLRAALGHPEGLDWRLVRQLVEWKSSGRFDDVLEAALGVASIGTTAVTLHTRFVRVADEALLVTAETVYVVTDPVTAQKRAVTEQERLRLTELGDVLVDCGAP
jgi:acyl-CoA thioester hydrolase